MKIAFVVQRYGLEVNGGAEQLCRLVAERLVSYCSVEVLSTCAIDYMTWANEYPSGEEIICGVIVRRFPVDFKRNIEIFNKKSETVFQKDSSINNQLEWMRLQGPFSSLLFSYLKEHKADYDAIIFFTYLYCTTFFGLPEVNDKAILVPTAHDEPPIHLAIFTHLFSLPKYILFNTLEERDFVHKKFKNEHIPSDIVGVAVQGPEKVMPEEFIHSYSLHNFILYVGRIDPSKGCQDLFDYFSRYKKEHPSDLKLVLIGNPVMPIPCTPDIISLGFVDEQTKFNAMAAARVLIMPSPYESLSMVLLESWYCKRPVLVNGKCPVLVGQCKRSNGGLWYENYEEFEAGLSYLLENQRNNCFLGESGYQFTMNNYDWKVIEKKYLDAVNYIIQQNH